jgi:hypothetical protein
VLGCGPDSHDLLQGQAVGCCCIVMNLLGLKKEKKKLHKLRDNQLLKKEVI